MKIAFLILSLISQVASGHDGIPPELQGVWKPTKLSFTEMQSDGSCQKGQVKCEKRSFVILSDRVIDVYDVTQVEGAIKLGQLPWRVSARDGNRYYFWFNEQENATGIRRRAWVELDTDDQIQFCLVVNRTNGAKASFIYALQRDDNKAFRKELEKSGVFPNPSGQWQVSSLQPK